MLLFASLRRAGRALRRRPGSTAAAALTLALGIAVSTAVFTLAEAVLFRKPPYPDVDRIVALKSRTAGKPAGGISWQDARDLSASRSFSNVAVFMKRTWGLSDSTGQPLEVVLSGMVTHGFFEALGAAPEFGESFTAGHEHPGDNRVVWLSHSLWQRRYQSGAQVLGRYIALNGVSYRIAGVLPAWFRFPIDGENPDLYFPLDETDYCCDRDVRSQGAVARMAPGVSMEGARAELAVWSERLRTGHPDTNGRVRFAAIDLQDALVGSRGKPLLLLLAAVGFLMLVATINAGGILLARAARDMHETAIRVSLGAGWRALVADRLAEAFWLTLSVGGLGLAGACGLLRGATNLPQIKDALAAYSQFGELWPDATVLAFSLLLSFSAAVLASLLPFLAMRRTSIEHLLRASGGASSSRQTVWARNAMATAQIALSAALLISGALVLQSLYRTLSSERGYRTDQVVIAGIGVPEARYDTDAKMIDFHTRVIERLRGMPGIVAGAGGAGVPIGTWRTQFLREGEELPKPERPKAAISVASPGLFRLLEIPLVTGRDFSPEDRTGQAFVAIVNRSFVARYLSGRQAIGARIRLGFYNGQMKPWSEFQVVGIVADTRNRSLDAPAEPAIFVSSTQVPLEGFSYMVRTTREAAGLVREFREAVWSVDRNVQAVTPRPLTQYVEGGLRERRLVLWVLGGFAVLALVIAAAGLGGSLAASVAEARREIGIRMALGELPSRSVARVMRGAAWIVLWGLLGGVATAAATRPLLASQIIGVSALAPAAIAGVLVILAMAAFAAALLPAWRAAHTDPVESLRDA